MYLAIKLLLESLVYLKQQNLEKNWVVDLVVVSAFRESFFSWACDSQYFFTKASYELMEPK